MPLIAIQHPALGHAHKDIAGDATQGWAAHIRHNQLDKLNCYFKGGDRLPKIVHKMVEYLQVRGMLYILLERRL